MLFEIGRQRFEHPLQRAIAHPALEAAVAGLVRWVAVWQAGPLGTGAQNPKDAVQHFTTAAPRASPSLSPSGQLANQRLQHRPLFIRQVHRCVLLVDAA